MTPTPDTELMACPFCGCEQWPITDKHDYWGPDGDHRNGCVMGSYDLCEFADKATMIAAWNTRIASARPAADALVDDLTKLANYADHADLGRADRDVIAAIYSRMSEALRQPAPRADDALREALERIAEGKCGDSNQYADRVARAALARLAKADKP